MDRDAVDVQWLEVDRVGAEGWTRLERLLDDDERRRAGQFRFDRDRLSYIAGHALVRAMLSERGGVAPAQWRFAAGPHGKPEMVMPGFERFRTNISHTGGLAAAAVTVDSAIGIDVERTEPGLTMDVAERFFAPAEVAALAAIPAERRSDAMVAVWTLKEAYIKAVGLGLSMPLETFAVTLEPLGIAFAAGVNDAPERWLLRRFHPTPTHAMALALRHGDPQRVTVTAHPADLDALMRLADPAGA
jgi:4'-phosphopantetheinyl transferase